MLLILAGTFAPNCSSYISIAAFLEALKSDETTHQEMTSDSVTVLARLAKIREGVKAIKTTCRQRKETSGVKLLLFLRVTSEVN